MRIRVTSTLVVLLGSAFAAGGATAQGADEIMDAALEAMGGRAAVQAVAFCARTSNSI